MSGGIGRCTVSAGEQDVNGVDEQSQGPGCNSRSMASVSSGGPQVSANKRLSTRSGRSMASVAKVNSSSSSSSSERLIATSKASTSNQPGLWRRQEVSRSAESASRWGVLGVVNKVGATA